MKRDKGSATMTKNHICVIGGGLAGSEAAWQIAKREVPVHLYEMKPVVFSPAHKLSTLGELVCTNSLRSDQLENAAGLLKEELRMLDSLIIRCADQNRVPAGGALAVDREKFSSMITEELQKNPYVTIHHEAVLEIPKDVICIVATGPLTHGSLNEDIKNYVGRDYLHFFDASAPIVTLESIDMTKAFRASRYGKGEDDYINCPMEKEEYEAFLEALVEAEVAPLKEFEDLKVFEGCMPVEVMGTRGKDTLRFGPLKPVGLINPNTGKEAYAVVQLRQDNKDGTLYNLVGFQTHLKWGEQKRVFGMIPGLEDAEFLRYGVMHRNTFIHSPNTLDHHYRMKHNPNLYFAGQITGVEGYIESCSSGLVAGINAARQFMGQDLISFPSTTSIGSLANYISDSSVRNFQPMNVNFGIMEKWEERVRDKKLKNLAIANRAIKTMSEIISTMDK
jgi:methylenetetrahydrofolate--tRNA-(uracil-5-)-methyltransferase